MYLYKYKNVEHVCVCVFICVVVLL